MTSYSHIAQKGHMSWLGVLEHCMGTFPLHSDSKDYTIMQQTFQCRQAFPQHVALGGSEAHDALLACIASAKLSRHLAK